MMTNKKILNLIESIRDSFDGAELIYSQGSCYQFHKILKVSVGYGLPLISEDGQHIITMIDNYAYDVRGERLAHGFNVMTEEQVTYFEMRKFNIHSPQFFIPGWFVDGADSKLDLITISCSLGCKVVEATDGELDEIEKEYL